MKIRDLFRIALVALVFGLPLGWALGAAPAMAQDEAPTRVHLDLAANTAIDAGWECTEWHELYPAECSIHHLDKIEGDGELEACNYAWFDGRRYHIDWVGPTYFLDCRGVVAEPSSEVNEDGNPVGEVWHEVSPNYCDEHKVVGWEDADGDGQISECDYVTFDNGDVCHVDRIGLDVIISPAPVPIGVEDPVEP